MCLHRSILAVVRDHSYMNLSDWRCKDTIFLFCSYAICDICVDSGKKLVIMIFLCFILKFDEIFPKNRKISPKDKLISPIDRKISPKNRKLSPKENYLLIIKHDKVCRRWFSIAYRTGFWMWFLWGEGWRVYFNLYIIFFILGFFRFLTLGSFFRFLPLFFTRIYKKGVFNPSPFTFLEILLMLRWLWVKGGEGWWRLSFYFALILLYI